MTLHKRRIASMALAIALLLMSPLPVFAGSASGSNATASSGSKSFVIYSNIYTSSSFADASQAIRSAQTTSAGEMGANPRLFTANGALYRDGGWQYSWSTLGGYNWLFFHARADSVSTETSWYSQGSGAYWNGRGYTTFSSGRSPAQTVR